MLESSRSNSSYESSDDTADSSSDDTDVEVSDVLSKDFFQTLSCLKKKDPRIYDPNVKFFDSTPQNSSEEQGDVTKLFSKVNSNSSPIRQPDTKNIHCDNANNKTSYFQKVLNDDEDSDGDDIKFKVDVSYEKNPEPDHIEYLKGTKCELIDKNIEAELKPLYELWNNDNLDPNEKFLRDYILNKKFLEKDENIKKLQDEVELSEDERELEEQEEFEDSYNKRFETEENMVIKRYPRNIDGSLRRKNESRKKKRAEIILRKKEEKFNKHKELKKVQRKKLYEIQEKLREIKELTGNAELGFKDEEILDDFDPDKHDKKMQELFNEDFYAQEDSEIPVFDDIEDENFIMDCDADLSKIKEKKMTRSQRKKNRKKKSFQDVLDLDKPAFDPSMHDDFKHYLDEYYTIDCEDFIEDIPCRFKYKEVVSNDFGLSIEEILMADDKELNQWASLKKLQKMRPDNVERNEVRIYKSKAKDEFLKKKILKSLYMNPEKEDDSGVWKVEGDCSNNLETERSSTSLKNKQKRKKERKISLNGIDNSVEETQNEPNYVEKKKHLIEEESQDPINNIKHDRMDSSERIVNKEVIKNNELNTQSQRSKKKKKRNRKKKNLTSDNVIKNKNDKVGNTPNNVRRIQKKNKFKSSKNNIVNLSDNRLLAYGIKPKKFRAKIIYGQNN